MKRNARFYGVNLLSELDVPGEYFIDEKALQLYFLPPGGITQIASKPIVLSVNASAVVTLATGTKHVQLVNLEVGFGRGPGIDAGGVSHVLIKNCTVHGLGTTGLSMSATNSAILESEVYDTGCAGVSAGGGTSRPLVPGNLTVRGNHIHHIANWKRTYQAAIGFSGSGNIYSDNTVGFAPHTCMTGESWAGWLNASRWLHSFRSRSNRNTLIHPVRTQAAASTRPSRATLSIPAAWSHQVRRRCHCRRLSLAIACKTSAFFLIGCVSCCLREDVGAFYVCGQVSAPTSPGSPPPPGPPPICCLSLALFSHPSLPGWWGVLGRPRGPREEQHFQEYPQPGRHRSARTVGASTVPRRKKSRNPL